MRRKRGRPRHDDTLTPTEWRILDGVRHGLSNAEIAKRRGVSVDAVKYHVANILQKLDAADRRELRQRVGAAKDSALGSGTGRRGYVNAPTANGSIGQIARTTRDIGKSIAWYRDVLCLQLMFTFDKLAFFDCNGIRLMLTETDKLADESIVYFRVADIETAHADLSARGAAFLSAPHKVHEHDDGTEEWMAFVKDPDERPIGLMSAVRR